MFEQSLFDRGPGAKTKTKYTMCASMFIQCMIVGVAMLIPLISTGTLPARQLMSYLAEPPPARSSLPSRAIKEVKLIPREFEAGRFIQPGRIPRDIAIMDDDEMPPPVAIFSVVGPPGGVPGGTSDGVPGSIVTATPAAPPEPPRAEVPKPAPPRIRVGGVIQKANLVYQPKPVYPPLARQARISGTVKLNAIISRDGAIEQLTVVSGHPLLVPAALEAVKQWRYKPTLLNNEPVEVITQIDVNFTLTP